MNLDKLHPACRGPWRRGDTCYPHDEHIRDCEKCLGWNRKAGVVTPEPEEKSRLNGSKIPAPLSTTEMLGERIARRDTKIARLERTIKRLESELAKERLAADFMR